MPLLTTTIDDPCPLLIYSPTGWTQGSGETDNLVSRYYQSSFHPTNVAGSTVSFTFNGTGIQIFGARRGNHGNFQIVIDNSTFPAISGVASTDRFQDTLFSTTSLTQGLHTITLTNQPTDGNHNFVDIDYVTWQSKIGNDDDQIVVKTFQDTDPAFVFQPSSSWSTNPDQIGLFSGGSGHSISNGTGGSFTFSFQGDGVQLFGPIGPEGASYSVQIDGGQARQFSTNKKFYTPQMMLYHADNLGDGKHILKLEYQPSPNQQLAIDYANVLSSSSMNSAQTTQSNTPGSSTSSSRLSGGIIAGIVIPVLIIIGCLMVVTIILLRRRRSLQAGSEIESPAPAPTFGGYDPAFASGGVDSTNVSYATAVRQGRPARASLSTMTFTSLEPGTVTRNSTMGRSNYTPEYTSAASYSEYSDVLPNRAPVASSSRPLPIPVNANSTSPHPASAAKGQTVLMPHSVGQNLSVVPEDELRSNRLAVEGRAQDFGSLTRTSQELAPPDYTQATEAYVLEGSRTGPVPQ